MKYWDIIAIDQNGGRSQVNDTEHPLTADEVALLIDQLEGVQGVILQRSAAMDLSEGPDDPCDSSRPHRGPAAGLRLEACR